MTTRTIRRAIPLTLLLLLLPRLAAACATCFGDPDSPLTEGLNMAILMLVGCVGLVYVGIGKVVWDIRKRSRQQQDPSELRLIQGGKN